jgi:hypothetical protein
LQFGAFNTAAGWGIDPSRIFGLDRAATEIARCNTARTGPNAQSGIRAITLSIECNGSGEGRLEGSRTRSGRHLNWDGCAFAFGRFGGFELHILFFSLQVSKAALAFFDFIRLFSHKILYFANPIGLSLKI